MRNMKRQNEDKLRVRLQVVCTERSTGVVLKVIECADDEDSIPSWSARSYPVIAASVDRPSTVNTETATNH